MTRLESHARFALMEDRDFIANEALRAEPHFPAVCTALADASGWLDDCESDDDLRAAAEQGASLYMSGVVDGNVIADAANDVIAEVMTWAEQQGGAAPCSKES